MNTQTTEKSQKRSASDAGFDNLDETKIAKNSTFKVTNGKDAMRFVSAIQELSDELEKFGIDVPAEQGNGQIAVFVIGKTSSGKSTFTVRYMKLGNALPVSADPCSMICLKISRCPGKLAGHPTIKYRLSVPEDEESKGFLRFSVPFAKGPENYDLVVHCKDTTELHKELQKRNAFEKELPNYKREHLLEIFETEDISIDMADTPGWRITTRKQQDKGNVETYIRNHKSSKKIILLVLDASEADVVSGDSKATTAAVNLADDPSVHVITILTKVDKILTCDPEKREEVSARFERAISDHTKLFKDSPIVLISNDAKLKQENDFELYEKEDQEEAITLAKIRSLIKEDYGKKLHFGIESVSMLIAQHYANYYGGSKLRNIASQVKEALTETRSLLETKKSPFYAKNFSHNIIASIERDIAWKQHVEDSVIRSLGNGIKNFLTKRGSSSAPEPTPEYANMSLPNDTEKAIIADASVRRLYSEMVLELTKAAPGIIEDILKVYTKTIRDRLCAYQNYCGFWEVLEVAIQDFKAANKKALTKELSKLIDRRLNISIPGTSKNNCTLFGKMDIGLGKVSEEGGRQSKMKTLVEFSFGSLAQELILICWNIDRSFSTKMSDIISQGPETYPSAPKEEITALESRESALYIKLTAVEPFLGAIADI